MPVTTEPITLSVNAISKLEQDWYPDWANTWAITHNWTRGFTDPVPYNIATSDTPNGWSVTPIFTSTPPEVAVTAPAGVSTDGQYSVFVIGDDPAELGNGFFVLPSSSGEFDLTEISGQEIVEGLSIGEVAEITVPHGGEAVFEFCEYPRCEAPEGVRVSVLTCGTNGDDTDGSQFVLLVENIDYSSYYGSDITIDWTRRGTIDD